MPRTSLPFPAAILTYLPLVGLSQRNAEEELLLIETIRKHVARILRTLKAEDFQRRGIHSEAGPLTLETLVQKMTAHIPHHVQFIEEKRKAMGKK